MAIVDLSLAGSGGVVYEVIDDGLRANDSQR